MRDNRLALLFLNIGHAYAHYFMLIHPSVVIALEGRGEGDYATAAGHGGLRCLCRFHVARGLVR